jgi:methionine-rich copper-binding protein CopC
LRSVSRTGRTGRRILALAVAPLIPVLLTGCFSAPPQIVALAPADGSTEQNADTPVEVLFDQPVEPASVAEHFGVCALRGGGCQPGLAGCPDLAAAFTAPPGSACWVHWLDGQSGFIFYHPGALFAPDTKYQFSLAAGLTSADGTVNSLDHIWQLTSAAAPALTSSSPGDGATQVPRDTAISLSFSRAMSPTALAAAVALSPADGTLTVIPDSLDTGAFEILPSRPLLRDTAYTLTVGRTATDAHGQPLTAPITLRFRTGAFSPGGHGVVLAGSPGGPATAVAITGLAPPSGGEPIPDEVLAEAPICEDASGCGLVAGGHPTRAIEAAALSPGSGWLALVETDLTAPATPPALHVVDLATGRDQIILSGAEWPSWSPDGSTLCFVTADGLVELYQPLSGTLTALRPPGPASGPAVWTAAGDTLAIPVAAAGSQPAHLDLANPAFGASYALPGISGPVTRVVAAPTGDELAVEVETAGGGIAVWVTDPSSGQPPVQLHATITPIGFRDAGTLLGATPSGAGRSELVSVSLGSGAVTALGAVGSTADLDGAALAPDSRQIGYLAASAAAAGGVEAMIANADGTGATPTAPLGNGLVPLAMTFGG